MYKTWGPLGIFSGLDKPGLYDNSAFNDVIEKYFNKKEFHRRISMTLTNLDSGLPEVYSEKNDLETVKRVLMASQSFPGTFPF